MKRLIFVMLVFFRGGLAFCQISSTDSLYTLNTLLSKISYYKSHNQFDKAAKLYYSFSEVFKNTVTSDVIADLFLKMGDSAKVEREIERIYSMEHRKVSIHTLTKHKNPFHFVYKKKQSYFDNLFLQNEYNYLNNRFLKDGIYNINSWLGADQFHRKNELRTNDVEINRQVLKIVDSINTVNFISLLRKDTTGGLVKRDFSLLSTLFLHLTRYDTNDFVEIINYCEKHLSKDILANYKAILTDNRLINNHYKHKYYVFLLKNKINDSLDFAKIDQDRREIGLSSLLFEIIDLKLPIPQYYQKEYEKLIIN